MRFAISQLEKRFFFLPAYPAFLFAGPGFYKKRQPNPLMRFTVLLKTKLSPPTHHNFCPYLIFRIYFPQAKKSSQIQWLDQTKSFWRSFGYLVSLTLYKSSSHLVLDYAENSSIFIYRAPTGRRTNPTAIGTIF